MTVYDRNILTKRWQILSLVNSCEYFSPKEKEELVTQINWVDSLIDLQNIEEVVENKILDLVNKTEKVV